MELAEDSLRKMSFPPADGQGNAAVPPVPAPLQDGILEVERYWVHEPYAFVSILYDNRAKEHTYLLCEPMLGDFEAELLERLYSDLRDI